MALSLRIPALLAGALATAIALAPAATADSGSDGKCVKAACARPGPDQIRSGAAQSRPNPAQNPLSSDFTADNLPKGWTNDAQWARPGASNPFGQGPRPPVVALD